MSEYLSLVFFIGLLVSDEFHPDQDSLVPCIVHDFIIIVEFLQDLHPLGPELGGTLNHAGLSLWMDS